MKASLRLSIALLLLALFCSAASAQMPLLRGYDAENRDYQYVTFGAYPYEKDGAPAPLLWRVLGRGVPSENDVIDRDNVPDRKTKKAANRDTLTEENDDVFLLMTEHVIDVLLYHPVRDVLDGPGLDYADSQIRETLCTDVLDRMFTEQEQAVLVDMPGRGLLALPSRRGELFHPDYGFIEEDFGAFPRRTATGTPYAFSKGLKRIKGHSWYWTTDWRTAGRRWIVGDNGHISVSGLDREGGIRPICYVRTDMLRITGGDGTLKNPFVLALK